jgi:phosphoenolpyruvate carboxylase
VERLRTACRERRLGAPHAESLEQLLAYVESLPLEIVSRVARSFALFFFLINTLEQAHRVRTQREKVGAYAHELGTLAGVFDHLARAGVDADAMADALARVEIRPVLTAHPTEATRNTLLGLQARIAAQLIALDSARADEREAIEKQIEAEVELLWLTAEVRADRPSVLEEVSNATWYLENRFLPSSVRLMARLRRAFASTYGRDLTRCSPLRVGSWVGGDRDGNPFVTPEVTREAVRGAAAAMTGAYLRAVRRLIGELALSTRVKGAPPALEDSLAQDRETLPSVWERNRERNAEEPLRLKLAFIEARLAATRDRLLANPAANRSTAYADVGAFKRDLELVRDALEQIGAEQAPRTHLDPLLGQVKAFGFHGYRLDVREDSRVHTRALEEIAEALGLPALDREQLRRELSGRRPLVGQQLSLDAQTRQVVEVFRTIRWIQDEVHPQAASTYILSMASSPEDLLRVLLLAREAALVDLANTPPRSDLDVVPLFETGADLERAPQVMKSLFDDPIYQRQLEARGMAQEVMIGYSDSAKDVGLLPASWALYRCQEELTRVCGEAGVSLMLFHGRGGTVGRGGGSPVFRALQALPRNTVQGRIKITEQGEVISQKFGLLPIAEESLEVMLAGTLMASFTRGRSTPDPAEEARFRATMEHLVETALPVYRGTVHQAHHLFQLFLNATPVRELAHVHFGSRPTYRQTGTESMATLRAIPWVFGWTQIRLNLPAWLGVGTALSSVCARAGGLELLRRMADSWPFFDDLLSKIEMVCAKSDLDIAELYVRRLHPQSLELLEELKAEYGRTVDAILSIRRARYLLSNQPLLQTALVHRDPYLDPLSLLQLSLLGRKQRLTANSPLREPLDRAIGTALNGIAQGLRNTG